MKNKIGFNLIFAFIAFPIGLALINNFDFETFTFKNTALGFLYLITFIVAISWMLKNRKKRTDE